MNEENLCEVDINHPTYHDFTGGGNSDSNLDKILFPKYLIFNEELTEILCKIEDPRIDSHHENGKLVQ